MAEIADSPILQELPGKAILPPGREPENDQICTNYKIPSVFISEEWSFGFNKSQGKMS